MAESKDYTGILPYASELFGIYQPLLGWRSRRIKKRYDDYRSELYDKVADRALTGVQAPVKVRFATRPDTRAGSQFAAQEILIDNFQPVHFPTRAQPSLSPRIDTAVARLLQKAIGSGPPAHWSDVIDLTRMTSLLGEVQKIITTARLLEQHPEVADYVNKFVTGKDPEEGRQQTVEALFRRESSIAGYLIFLAQHNPSVLSDLFFRESKTNLQSILLAEDPLLNFGNGNYSAVLSPLGLIHIYREYFFEFDSFLGPPVGHVWLSPGGTVELIEINTRRVFTERTIDSLTETVTRSETSTTNQDELADAVKEENHDETKFGFANVATVSTPFVQDTATANFSLDTAKTESRETTHKRMRQQSEKLSSEIKKSFKTTFRTSTDVTDTSSKRYVITNTTGKLVNYELRRKMRKVGVQVQDIGTQLCWHTFVDDPGRELGISKLVHIAQAADLADIPQPDSVPSPVTVAEEKNMVIPFSGGESTDDSNQSYTDGRETSVAAIFDSQERIQADFVQNISYKESGYTLAHVTVDTLGLPDVRISIRSLRSAEGSSTATFTVHLDFVHFHGKPNIAIKLTLVWAPSQASRDLVDAENTRRVAAQSAEKARRFKETFFKSARERIKLASDIQPRPAEDLREEERTAIYRNLIRQLTQVGTGESRHVISELVRSIFDVDKMLYFVAPEWWASRVHHSGQHLGEDNSASSGPGAVLSPPAGFGSVLAAPGAVASSGSLRLSGNSASNPGSAIPSESIVDWGGGREIGRDNYYITEDSRPAKFGSSLGWLLQLDGDNLRNAVLNSPWVKAVIPIRLGKERAAINWLQQAHVEGSDGLDAAYLATADDPPELQPAGGHTPTLREALDFLIGKIHGFDRTSRTPIVPNPADPEDSGNHFAGSLPAEAVFEHGFYPLKGGTKFDQDGTSQSIFSQWQEILPTDQVAALEVEYDPRTLQVIAPDDDE